MERVRRHHSASEFSRFGWILVIKFSLYKLRHQRWSFLLISASGRIKIHQETTYLASRTGSARITSNFCKQLVDQTKDELFTILLHYSARVWDTLLKNLYGCYLDVLMYCYIFVLNLGVLFVLLATQG